MFNGKKPDRDLQGVEMLWNKVAVLAVFGERLSGFKFPDTRENTGKFCRSSREGGKTARFFD